MKLLMRTTLRLLFLVLLATLPLRAADIYVAQAALGGNTGANCTNARASTSLAAGDFTAGNTIHICNAFNGVAGQSAYITAQASGSVGNPVTIIFEPGAVMQAPYFGTNGAINTNGKTDLVIDGGTNGIIQNTANGDELANQQISFLIAANGCHRCIFQNLNLTNEYVAAAQNSVVNTQNGATGGCAANCVTWVSGKHFNTNWITGVTNAIKINNVNFTLASVQSSTVATLTAAPGTTTNQPWSWTFGSNMTSMNAIQYTGQNTIFRNNVIHDCGWCTFTNYANNDTAYQVYGNEVYNYDHAFLFATAGGGNACLNDATYGCYNAHDNKIHDNINFETFANQPTLTNCSYHLDGFHFFGTGPGTPNSMDGIYAYNNYFYGTMSGPCSSGFFFMEKDASAQGANAKTCGFWNNVMDATGADVVWNSGNPNGWMGIFSCSTSILVANNTLLYNDILESAGPTNGYNIGSGSNLTFKNNLSNAVNMGNNIGSIGGTKVVNYNYYSGPPCHLSNNCLIFNGSFMGSFATWKSTSGFDALSFTSTPAAVLINSNGSPQSGSPLIQQGDNLTSLATGKFATLASDTTLGGLRAPIARPTGTCPIQGGVNCWEIGAFQFGSVPSIANTPDPLAFGNQFVSVTSGSLTVTVTNSGGGLETLSSPFFTITGPNAGDFARSGGTLTNGGTIAASGGTGTITVTCTPGGLGARTATLNINGTASASSSLTCTGIPSSVVPAPVNPLIVNAMPIPAPSVQPVLLTSSPTNFYATPQGCSQDMKVFTSPCRFIVTCSGCDSTTQFSFDGKSVTQTFANGMNMLSVPAAMVPAVTAKTSHVITASNPTPGVPILN